MWFPFSRRFSRVWESEVFLGVPANTVNSEVNILVTASTPEPRKPRRPPATTLEQRENQLIILAMEVAEKQMREGRAPAQVVTHYLKLGTTRERSEQEKLRRENLLLEAKVGQIAQGDRLESLAADALKAFRGYSGQDEEVDED